MIEIFGFREDKIVCPNCMKSKRLCEENGVEYKFHSVITDLVGGKAVRDIPVVKDLVSRMGWTWTDPISVPQIFVDGKHVGGLQDLRAYFRNGKIDE
ncbi:MAG: glutaredoxin domain-containing protein [Aeromonas veronii]